MTDKIETGSQGENLAAEFFAEQGFKVVARNYRWKRAEIDLIVERENWLIFVDDLGYGELGCQGNAQIPTPNIDS